MKRAVVDIFDKGDKLIGTASGSQQSEPQPGWPSPGLHPRARRAPGVLGCDGDAPGADGSKAGDRRATLGRRALRSSEECFYIKAEENG